MNNEFVLKSFIDSKLFNKGIKFIIKFIKEAEYITF